ncbi:sensor histidine kinase [Massilia sp. DD77]|uniref:sensor histidine kinase n=1 Tax=Massilia sp. DD77 TaxID=3109349 RepID=UPI002FFED151
MTEPAHPHSAPELERQVAARTADLTEMLAYLAACWDEEKRLLARQLHDSLGSSMTALTMHLSLLSQHIPAENKAMRDRSAQMKQLLATIIETNRKMQLDLWNDKLEFLGLRAALAELVPEFGARQGLAARASLPDEDGHYSRTQGVVLLRCAEEGLRNAAVHGQASEVEVILDDDGEQLMLTVRDNGAGPRDCTAAMNASDCHGLRLLRERARHLGGELVLLRGEAGGAVLRMTLPRETPA